MILSGNSYKIFGLFSLLPEINDCFINILRIDFVAVALDFHWQIFMAAPMKLAWAHFSLPQPSTQHTKKKNGSRIPIKYSFGTVRGVDFETKTNTISYLLYLSSVSVYYIGWPMPTYTISHLLNFRSSHLFIYK